eukprot:6212288-Pleurochrysis_carterae.AAC.2
MALRPQMRAMIQALQRRRHRTGRKRYRVRHPQEGLAPYPRAHTARARAHSTAIRSAKYTRKSARYRSHTRMKGVLAPTVP